MCFLGHIVVARSTLGHWTMFHEPHHIPSPKMLDSAQITGAHTIIATDNGLLNRDHVQWSGQLSCKGGGQFCS